MIRRLLLATLVCLTAGVFSAKGHVQPPTVFAVPAIANNCGDPAHTSAVSLWSYTASNGTSGQFTMTQGDIGDSSAAGVALSASLDALTIHNVLGTDFGGQLMKLGSAIFIIAKSQADGTFMVSFIDGTGPAQINILTIGGPSFISLINATLVTGGCYNNLVANPSFEATFNNNSQLLNWSASGGNATWLRSFNGANLDRFTAQSAVQSAETLSPNCGSTPSDSYWLSDAISVSDSTTYVAGAYEHSLAAEATGKIELDYLIFGFIPGGTYPISSRAGTSWGLTFGSVTFPAAGTVRVRLSVDVNACTSAPVTRYANFDDVFLINTGTGPAPTVFH